MGKDVLRQINMTTKDKFTQKSNKLQPQDGNLIQYAAYDACSFETFYYFSQGFKYSISPGPNRFQFDADLNTVKIG